MSTLDLNSILDSLRSPKIKTRNEVLNLLQRSPFLKLANNPKQLQPLLQGLLKTIETERDAYVHNPLAPVSPRVTAASSVLRELIEASLGLPTKRRPKHKSYLAVVNAIVGLYFVSSGHETFVPCCADFAKILDLLLKLDPFFSHLSAELWTTCYNFAVKAVSLQLDDPNVNDGLLRDLVSTLTSLVGKSATILLPLAQLHTYFSLLPVLKGVVKKYTKRENPIIISAFRIINQVLAALSTEDFHFANRLIRLGVTAILQFSSTSLQPLFSQFLSFLNQDSFYRYYDISSYPKLVDAELLEEAGLDLYSLGMLIHALLERSQAASLRLNPEEVSVCDTKTDLFHLPTIAHCSDNSQPWLLLTAISRLIILFYRLRRNNSYNEGYRGETPPSKRQKLLDYKNRLFESTSALQFLSFILEANDTKPYLSLQLLLFLFEWQPPSCEPPGNRDPNESSLLLAKEETSELKELLSKLLRLMSEKNLTFWVLAAFRSIFRSLELSGELDQRYFKQLHQMLKLLVSLVKEKSLCFLSCSLFCEIVSLHDSAGLQKLFDDSILSQLQSVLDLSDLAGPAILSSKAIRFWESLAHVLENVGFLKKGNLLSSVLRWLLGKWDDAFGNLFWEASHVSPVEVGETILWIGGFEVSKVSLGMKKVSFADMLERFMSLEDEEELNVVNKSGSVTKIIGSSQLVSEVTTEICEKFKNEFTDDMANLLAYAIFLMQVSEAIQPNFPEQATELQNKVCGLSADLAPMINLKEKAGLAVTVILKLKPTHDILCELCFPFELIDYQFSFLTKNEIFDTGANELDSEFSQTHIETFVKEKTPQRDDIDPVEYFEFLLRYQKCSESELSRYIRSLPSRDAVTCLALLADSPSLVSLATQIHLLGEGPLSCPDYDRMDETVLLACRLSRKAIGGMNSLPELEKDCLDIIVFFLQCFKKNLFLSETLLAETWIVCLEYTENNREESVSNAEIRSLFLQSFAMASNRMKIEVSDVLTSFIASKDLSTQLLFFQEVCQSFPTPQSSVERSATFAYFLSLLTRSNTQISLQVLLVLLEYSKFPFFLPYLTQSVRLIARNQQKENARSLFRDVRIDLMIASDQDFLAFPFQVFGYPDLNAFFHDNYRHITASLFSFENIGGHQKKLLLDYLTDLKSCTVPEIVQDSLPLIIALGYTAKGTRNKVFKSLLSLLQDLYQPTMREMLILLILEIARLTDVRSMPALGAALNKAHLGAFSSKKVINVSQASTISPVSSVDLTSNLIAKYSQGAFWQNSTVYFLIRQLSLSLETNGISQKVAVLRRIQFFWHISRVGFLDYHTVLLLFEILSPLIGTGFDDEISSLLDQIDLGSFALAPAKDVLHTIIEFFAHLGQSHVFNDFIKRLEVAVLTLPELDALKPALQALFTAQDLSIDDFEAFLTHDSMSKAISNSFDAFIRISSKLFSCTRKERSTILSSPSPRVMEIFSGRTIAKQSGDFEVWVSEYLADFYLSGQSFHTDPTSNPMMRDCELAATDFELVSTTFNPFVEYLLEAHGGNTKAFVESILGVISYNLGRKSDITELVDPAFKARFLFVFLMDHHSCSLLNHGTRNVRICLDGEFLQGECEFMLSLVRQLVGFPILTAVITSCILRLPEVAVKALPSFVLLFLHLADAKYKTIVQYFEEWNSNCPEKIELMTKIFLNIRVGAKKNVHPYKKVYDSLDLEKIFYVAKESKLPACALMIFEDYVDNKPERVEWRKHRQLLTDIYCALDEFDLISGMPYDVSLENSFKLLNRDSLSAESFKHDSSFMDASLILHETYDTSHMIQSSLDDGMLGLSKVLSGPSSNCEWSWKLNQWQVPATESTREHDVIYSYFRQIHDAPATDIKAHEARIYNETMRRLICHRSRGENISSKSLEEQNQVWLKTLAVVRSAGLIFKSIPDDFVAHVSDFEKHTPWFESAEPSFCEDIVFARRLAFDFYRKKFTENSGYGKDLCWQGEANEILRYNGIFQKGNHQKAINSSVLLEKLIELADFEDNSQHAQLRRFSTYQAAQTLWAAGKTSIPIAMISELEESNISLPFPRLSVSLLLIKAYLAKWKAESRLDLGINILRQIVGPMEPHIRELSRLGQRAKVYNILARFCEQQHKSRGLKDKIRELGNRVHDRQKELEDIKNYYRKHSAPSTEKRAVQKYYIRLKNQLLAEVDELERAKETKLRFASTSLRFYLEALSIEDKDEHVDKFFSAFFELSGDEQLQRSLQKSLSHLSSYKPVTWCSQILSRVSNEDTAFQRNLHGLILKICVDHPLHALYPLLSLVLNEKMATETSNGEMLARAEAAKRIRATLNSSSSRYASHFLLPIEKLCQECVSLAEVKSTKGKPLHLDKLKIGTYFMEDLPRLPPPTLEVQVSRTGYENVPVMTKMDTQLSVAASGLSQPKIAKLYLSNGKQHKMLLKHGADDLRQDAIMEQVFGKVNLILLKDKETRKQNLLIRTYRAVPLGPRAGVIEFVPNSKALIELLEPYHSKMDKMKGPKARDLMKKNQSEDAQQRLKVYQGIESAIKPVLRYFFAEKFLTPDSWFHSRQLYTRGVATTSMIGHILGLGDRHCNNILLDEFTGEPIHIDFGVAFDQGRRLPIPELVPFRLTRDIVDGFGFMGTNGSFSKLCEHTFRVLRSNQEQILAILDVLRWDPLYSWTISPIRKRRLQEDNPAHMEAESRQTSEAESAILMVTEKLHAGGLSVEATVRDLIREAESEQHLAVIYCGWYPFY